jgi:hypothetical protein
VVKIKTVMNKYFCYCIEEIETTGYHTSLFEVGVMYEYAYKTNEVSAGYIRIYVNPKNSIQLTHKQFRRFFKPVTERRDMLINDIIGTD